jgi:hypothetical protein
VVAEYSLDRGVVDFFDGLPGDPLIDAVAEYQVLASQEVTDQEVRRDLPLLISCSLAFLFRAVRDR